MKKTVALSMIVKNESHIILECLNSIYKYIDYWVIVDTGSTDGTQDIIKNFFAEKGIPGELHERSWVNFGHNRSEALALCDSKADYMWMIDADDFVEGDFKYPDVMNADGYAIRMGRPEFSWWRTQIYKTGIGWKYEGVLHEYATCPSKQPTSIEKIPGKYYIVARTVGGRNIGVDPIEKYSKDAITLEEALKKEPNNTRYQFYLGQSYFDSQQWEKSIEAYTKRAQMGGWPEEIFYSLLRVAIAKAMLNRPWEEIQQAFLESFSSRPSRAEPLYHIARIYRLNNKPALAYLFAKMATSIPYPKDDILFVVDEIYTFGALDELGSVAFYAGYPVEGYEACKKLITENRVPDPHKERVANNLKHYEAAMEQIKVMQAHYQAKINEAKIEQKLENRKARRAKEKLSRSR
jgi:glycosyltransferase involved in cell wall biosynthesis